MNDLAIVCFSCDKDEEMWPTFYTCLNKYWPNHPKTYLLTETKKSPLMETICFDYDLNKWTTRIVKSLIEVDAKKVIFICDDCFLNDYVNVEKLKKCEDIFNYNPNTAYINFELAFNYNDLFCPFIGFRRKTSSSSFLLSLLCGLWDKQKLIDILLVEECSPWKVEKNRNLLGYDAYQVADKKIISWFRDGVMQFAACHNGKWSKDVVEFLKKEGITMDLDKKGFY